MILSRCLVTDPRSVTGDGLRILIHESRDMILNRIDLAESRIRGEPLPVEPAAPQRQRPEIPQPVGALLGSIARSRYGSLEGIPVVLGVDETVFHLDRATQWHLRRDACISSHAFRLASIMTAYWLLQAIKAGAEYQSTMASPVISIDEFEEQLVRWGMTTRRFISKLEEVLSEHRCRPSSRAALALRLTVS